MTNTPFFQTLSSGSDTCTFSFNRIKTALIAVLTASGGEPKAFISPMCFFSMQSTADFAASRAGRASARALSQSAFSFPASFEASFVLASSMLAIYCCSSAKELSLPTLSISKLVSWLF